MCACFDGNAIGKEFARQDMETLFLEDYYMTVLNGRPLMFYFGDSQNLVKISEDILFYRELAQKLGVPEPYAVVMNVSAEKARSVCADAVSSYAIAGANNAPFTVVMNHAYTQWEEWNDSGMQYVPTVSFGWNPEPRYVNPVSWTTVENNSWAQYPTANDIEEHLIYALSYMENPSVAEQTRANILLAYAWNEHDEGGWICPTIAVDENGNALYNEDGTKKVNTERIDSTKKALAEFDGGRRVERIVRG